jgi:hypothetical protein
MERRLFRMVGLLGALALGACGSEIDGPDHRRPHPDSILPPAGTVRLENFDGSGNALVRFDTQGNAIDAHGGEIRRFGERYYLYGEHYACGFEWKNASSPFCGFRVYSSENLVDWEDRGLLFEPSTSYWQTRCSPGPLAADYGCFRPHVAFNPNTRKYVLWINGYGVPINFQVFEADSPTGPFVERGRPELAYQNNPGWGVNFGDENLFVDTDGTGYLVYTDWTTGGDILIEKLDPSFLGTSGTFRKLGLRGVEAPSMFKRGSRYYITLSDPNCGYCTTGTSYITAPSPLGPWSARKKLTTNSCGGQPGHVSALPTADGGTWYLYQSDLWLSGEANQAPAPQFWAPLSFTASGEIEPITCRSSYHVPALIGAPPSPEAQGYRLGCDIGESGRVQRAFRFTAAGERLHSLWLNTYQRGRPSEPLVLELREDAPGGRLLQQREIEPARIAWSARKLTLPLDLPVQAGQKYALRLQSASAQGCYGFAYRDDLPTRPAEAFLSTDGGRTWTAEPARSVRLQLSFQAN